MIETAIYRVVQESLHNVAKHAQARNVDIIMEREGETLKLVIEDDGTGMRPGDQSDAPFVRNGRNARAHQHPGRPDESGIWRKGEGTRITITGALAGSPRKKRTRITRRRKVRR